MVINLTMAYKKGLAARVKRVEAKVARNKPETKVYTTKVGSAAGVLSANSITYADLGGIVQGSDLGERIGNKIRVHKVEVFGVCSPKPTIFLLKSKLAAAPAYADYTDSTVMQYGALLDDNLLNNVYVELKRTSVKGVHYNDVGGVQFSKSWKAGIPVSFEDGTTDTVAHNNLYVVVVNNTAGAVTCGATVRFWYTDV